MALGLKPVRKCLKESWLTLELLNGLELQIEPKFAPYCDHLLINDIKHDAN